MRNPLTYPHLPLPPSAPPAPPLSYLLCLFLLVPRFLFLLPLIHVLRTNQKGSSARVLVNSLPKSDTHLLAKAIQIFGYREYFTSANYVNNTPKFLGSYEIRRVLKNQSVIDSKHNEEQCLNKGGYAEKAGLKIYSFAHIYRSILAWDKDPNCLLVRFEDLIGEQGGGNSQKQAETLKNLADHLNISWNNAIARQTKNVYDPNTRTFRVGNIHSWKNALDAEDLRRLTEYCEPLCQEAGYDV